jgi:hypothetical protein
VELYRLKNRKFDAAYHYPERTNVKYTQISYMLRALGFQLSACRLFE